MSSFIVTIDQGSSATKVLAFDHQGRETCRAFRSLKIERPQPTHIEQDPIHVLEETRKALEEVVSSIDREGHEILSIGLACQRSSFLLWNRERGRALTPIITWQDLRAKSLCVELDSRREVIYKKTGLPLTGHYGGPKFLWLIQNEPEIFKWLTLPGVIFSPWNSFLLWHLTEERICATDESIAGRTLFFNIHKRSWDEELVHLFKIPKHILPEIRPTCHLYGHYKFKNQSIPITCSIGDHQAALLGLGGLMKGQCGLNYGTSAGVLVNIGSKPLIAKGVLTNIAYSTDDEVTYTAEGTVNAVGSLFEWFERERGIPGASRSWETLVAPSSEGCYMIPGMFGIAAPYWKETVVTEFKGDRKTISPEVLLRAGMESIAFLVVDIVDQLRKIPDLKVSQIVAGGGAARQPLLQFQADLLGLPIIRSAVTDATALGCALLIGVQLGFWKNTEEIQDIIGGKETYYPQISSAQRRDLLDGWHDFLRGRGILT